VQGDIRRTTLKCSLRASNLGPSNDTITVEGWYTDNHNPRLPKSLEDNPTNTSTVFGLLVLYFCHVSNTLSESLYCLFYVAILLFTIWRYTTTCNVHVQLLKTSISISSWILYLTSSRFCLYLSMFITFIKYLHTRIYRHPRTSTHVWSAHRSLGMAKIRHRSLTQIERDRCGVLFQTKAQHIHAQRTEKITQRTQIQKARRTCGKD